MFDKMGKIRDVYCFAGVITSLNDGKWTTLQSNLNCNEIVHFDKKMDLFFKPTRNWVGKEWTFEIVIHGGFNSDYKKIQRIGEAFWVHNCFRNNVMWWVEVACRGIYKYVCLSMMEAELSEESHGHMIYWMW